MEVCIRGPAVWPAVAGGLGIFVLERAIAHGDRDRAEAQSQGDVETSLSSCSPRCGAGRKSLYLPTKRRGPRSRPAARTSGPQFRPKVRLATGCETVRSRAGMDSNRNPLQLEAMQTESPFPDLPADGKLLGLDLGTKTIGVAISDGLRLTATPLETISRTKFTADAERLQQLVAENAAVAFVLGLPLNMDGSEGPRVQSARAFARNLRAIIPLPILFWDERLSTAAVDRMLIEGGTRRDRRAEVIDKLAASYILQGFLDRLRINP